MINFIKCTAQQYSTITKNPDNFYYVTDENKFYLGEIELSDQDLSDYLTSVSAKDNSIAVTNNSEIAVKISAKTGNNLSLQTGAGEEGLYVNVPAQTDYSVTITESTPSGVAKRYTVAQQGSTIGTIDIPKDMVVEEGSVVDITYNSEDGKLYDGQTDVTSLIKGTGTASASDAGKYIKLEIANSANDKLYIFAKDLVDIYTVQQNAAQVQLAINNNVISASIVAGSVSATELASNAVETAKIKDKNVTLGKLEDTVQTSLGKADTAVQTIATGSVNGTISVDGTDVSVKGLKSAAYTESSAYDVSGAASAVLGQSTDTASQVTVYGVKKYAESLVSWQTLSNE